MSYNYGARNKERMEETFKYTIKAIMTFTFLFFIGIMLFPKIFIELFTKDQELIEISIRYLRIYMAGTLAMGVQIACQHTFLALGNARTSLFLSLLRKILILIPLIYILPMIFENKVFAIFFAEPIADILAGTITGILFYKYFTKTLKSI